MGEVREVTLHEKRIKEAKRLGYDNFITSSKYDFLQKAIAGLKNA
jgi:predicted ATP-dependent serine protease